MSFPTNRQTPLDRIIDIMYVPSGFNLNSDKSVFFKFRACQDKENNNNISEKVGEAVKELNKSIANESVVKEIDDEINNKTNFAQIFGDVNFNTESNINSNNIYESLDIIAYGANQQKFNNIGDGKSKTLSLLLKNSSVKAGKERIIIVEEPENHLYPILQRQFSALVDSLQVGQIITTTHSSTIVDFKKMKTIMKMSKAKGRTLVKLLNVPKKTDFIKYGFSLDDELAQMMFCDSVLLVEGLSEKYFYNRLAIESNDFLKYCTAHNFGVFAVGGVDFNPYKNLLSKLGIKVFIKTDNDLYKTPNSKENKEQYAGYLRVLDCLSKQSKSKLQTLMGWKETSRTNFITEQGKENIQGLEDKSQDIQNLFANNGVFLSTHHEGFEKDFLDFVDFYTQDNMDYLREAKLKNLHQFICDNKISLKINDRNKDSILLRFMNV